MSLIHPESCYHSDSDSVLGWHLRFYFLNNSQVKWVLLVQGPHSEEQCSQGKVSRGDERTGSSAQAPGGTFPGRLCWGPWSQLNAPTSFPSPSERGILSSRAVYLLWFLEGEKCALWVLEEGRRRKEIAPSCMVTFFLGGRPHFPMAGQWSRDSRMSQFLPSASDGAAQQNPEQTRTFFLATSGGGSSVDLSIWRREGLGSTPSGCSHLLDSPFLWHLLSPSLPTPSALVLTSCTLQTCIRTCLVLPFLQAPPFSPPLTLSFCFSYIKISFFPPA